MNEPNDNFRSLSISYFYSEILVRLIEPIHIIDYVGRTGVTDGTETIIPYRYNMFIQFGYSICYLLNKKADGFYLIDSSTSHAKQLYVELIKKNPEYMYVDSLPEYIRSHHRKPEEMFVRSVNNMTGTSLECDLAREFLKENGYL